MKRWEKMRKETRKEKRRKMRRRKMWTTVTQTQSNCIMASSCPPL